MSAIHTPALRYFGAKWRMANKIIEHFPEHKLFVDVFGGSASILISKPQTGKEVFNDLNEDLVNFYKVLRKEPAKLTHLLRLTPYAKHSFLTAHEPSADALEAARRFFCKSWMAVGGAGIRHKSGFRRSYRSDIRPEHNYQQAIAQLHQVAYRFSGVMIENTHWRQLVESYDAPSTLLYCDPPYPQSTRTGNQRYVHDFKDADHAALLDCLVAAKSNVVLSSYDNPLYSEALSTWQRVSFPCNTSGQVQRNEVLYIKSNQVKTLFT